jgi:hypothetical protein
VVTTIRISPRLWRVLRGLAETRALEGRGRPSASAVVSDLVEREAARRTRAKVKADA